LKILVTGGAGFVGSHIADHLIAQGDQVVIVDNISTGKEEHIHPSARFYRVDITDDKLFEVFKKEKPEVVIHQAAQVLVPKSVENPIFDAKVNILGTLNLLEASRQYGVRKIVYASSAAVYGDPQYLPIDEKHPVQPLSGYGISKHTPEHYLAAYHDLYGLEFTALRYANIYGIRQEPHGEGGVISILINQILEDRTFTIFGDGEQTRDYIYVEDVVKANLAAIHGGNGSILNIGTGVSTSLNDLINLFEMVINKKVKKEYGDHRSGDIKHSYFNPNKAKLELSWNAKISLEDGLRRTYEYYANLYRKMGKKEI
jgi:UDP-glucose 4-epimerase